MPHCIHSSGNITDAFLPRDTLHSMQMMTDAPAQAAHVLPKHSWLGERLSIGEVVGVDQREQPDLFSPGAESLRHFKGDEAAKARSAEIVGSMWLNSANLLEVEGCRLFHRPVGIAAVQTFGLYAVKG